MRIVSGIHKGRRIKVSAGRTTRPTTDKSKESLFNMIGPYFEGGTALDLFAGSGNLGIEALSRGIDRCIFIDRDRQAFSTIKTNLTTLDLSDHAETYKIEAMRALKIIVKRSLTFDLIFLDPPYKNQSINKIIEYISEHKLLAENGIVVAEYHKDDEIKKEFDLIEEVQSVTHSISKISIFKYKQS